MAKKSKQKIANPSLNLHPAQPDKVTESLPHHTPPLIPKKRRSWGKCEEWEINTTVTWFSLTDHKCFHYSLGQTDQCVLCTAFYLQQANLVRFAERSLENCSYNSVRHFHLCAEWKQTSHMHTYCKYKALHEIDAECLCDM